MNINLFAYPSNFGKISIYKCDYFGNSLSKTRVALAEGFTASENLQPDDTLLFGGYNQPNFYSFPSRDISLNVDFLFSLNLAGGLDPAIDLLMNSSAYAFQGTNLSYKSSLSQVSATSLICSDLYAFRQIQLTTSSIFKFYLVSPQEVKQIFPTSVNTTTGSIQYDDIGSAPANCWLEVFKYGNSQTNTVFPIYYEPMLRLDTSEGSFYPCIIDELSFSVSGDYIKIACKLNCINFDTSTRFEFINSTQNTLNYMPIIPLHKSRVLISNYVNDVSSTFLITDLRQLDSLNMLATQNPSKIPVIDFNFSIKNTLNPLYGNSQENMKRRYVRAYYSKERKIEGSVTTLALRSSQPTFNHYPVLNNLSNTSIQFNFVNQNFTIPYAIWKPASLSSKQDSYVTLKHDWTAITRTRDGQPLFEYDGV